MFSDETTMQRSQFVRLGRGSCVTMAHTTQHCHFLAPLIFWGSFMSQGRINHIPILSMMNATKYKQVLEQQMIPKVTELFPGGGGVFQQDNAPCHKPLLILNFLQKSSVSVLEWPPYSPDLSLIEDLCTILKKKVRKQSIRSKDDLIRVTNDIRINDPSFKEACKALMDSMAQRIQKCIEANGGPIKY